MKKIEDELIRAMMDQHVNEGRELFGKDGMIQGNYSVPSRRA